VAPQRKSVNPARFVWVRESIRKCPRFVKESRLIKGARGVQTLYMTGTMQKSRKRETAILQALD
jgi:hypothetical protein